MEFILFIIVAYIIFRIFKNSKRDKIDLSILPDEFIVFDLETTGLSATIHEIIEIGAIKAYRDSDHHDTYQTLVKPDKPIPSKITEITGITQKMVDDEGIDLETAINDFIEFIGDHRLVAYNMKFDIKFLRNAFKKFGKKITNSTSCALVMARRAWPELDS